MDPHANLGRALLALARITGIGSRSTGDYRTLPKIGFARIRADMAIAVVAHRILGVEEIEYLRDDVNAGAPKQVEGPGDAQVDLRERRAAQRVHMGDSRGEVHVVSVLTVGRVGSATDVSTGPLGERRSGVIANNARDVDCRGGLVKNAQGHTMAGVSVQRPEARAPGRIVGVDRLVTNRAEVRLMAGIRETKLIRPGENVACRLRQGVKALHLELLTETGPAAEVDAVVLRLTVAFPDSKAAELVEASLSGGGVDDGVGAEAERKVPVIDV